MTFTDIKQRYPKITKLMVSMLLGGAYALSVTTIAQLLHAELHPHTMMMISMAIFFTIDSYRKHSRTCISSDPRIPSIMIAITVALFMVSINTVLPLGLSSASIRMAALALYFVSVIYVPAKYPQYREKNGNPTISEKLKDMHGE